MFIQSTAAGMQLLLADVVASPSPCGTASVTGPLLHPNWRCDTEQALSRRIASELNADPLCLCVTRKLTLQGESSVIGTAFNLMNTMIGAGERNHGCKNRSRWGQLCRPWALRPASSKW